MITLVFNIKEINNGDKEFIDSLQHKWSVAFRKVYSNIELMLDSDFKDNIIKNYIFSQRAYEYLCKEVISFYDKFNTLKVNKLKLINELKEELKDNKLNKKELKKKQKELSSLLKQVNNNVVFGSRVNLHKVTKYSRLYEESKEDKYKKLLDKFRKIYKESRILPMTFYGEQNRKGNRFFDFKDLSNGNIIFKYETLKRPINIKFYVNKGYKNTLKKLELMCLNGEIPLTVKVTKDKIYLTYEEGKLTGKYLDIKAFYKTITNVKDKEIRKELITNKYREHEKKNFKDLLSNRYCSIDLNPKGIGYSILDKINDKGEFNVIKKGYICFNELSCKRVSSDKRKYEISVAIKKLFKELDYYKVSHFVVEELDNISNLKSNRETNRLVKNIWNRNYLDNLINKWCNHYGLKLIKINPCYSSFIGNILHNEYDPVASSIEIGRRGIIKYIKGSDFYPSFHKGVITEIVNTIEMDYNELLNVSSWIGAWKIVSAAKKSVRRLDVNNFKYKTIMQNKTKKSKVKTLIFQ